VDSPDIGPERYAELGLAAFAFLLLGALAVLLGGRVWGGLRRRGRHAEGPPERGSIPPSRQRAPAATAAR
jgi:hypothetical protein